MTEPVPWADEPRWKQRLLRKTHEATAQWLGQLRENDTAIPFDPVAATALQRAQARASDLRNRAWAHGIPQWWVADVMARAHRGLGYLDCYPDPDHGANPMREALIDVVADDVWQLQHTAALVVARRERLAAAGAFTEPDPATAGRVERAMVGLWWRAGAVADSLALTGAERDQLWATDIHDWRRLLAATVAGYDDAEIDDRWRASAATDVDLTALAADNPGPDDTHGPIPPPPAQMIAAAEAALADPEDPPPAGPGASISAGVDTVLPEAHTALGEAGPAASGPDNTPVDRGFEVEP
ncbi:hypothetical protein [Nocardia wallacei]|uniref:hypothetical protein n=1 Tax=Nocardia wallacei TaxID=480035 RepID=UPI002454F8CD|nr:hypothetical protein [Nocardia wallacei]